MGGYEDTRWADSGFSGNYASSADDMIMERDRLVGVLVSFYGRHLSGLPGVELLDLGCGDGALTRVLAERFGNMRPTLLDGSSDMLERARGVLAGVETVRFVKASFQDLLAGSASIGEYGFVFSSLAIHHLYTDEKAALYGYIYDHLEDGGYFLNIDVVLPPSRPLEDWYLDTWRAWVDGRGRALPDGLDGAGLVALYKDNEDNKPDTLERQLGMLSEAGFTEVDCYYKNGIFAVFGGKKQANPS